jgi:hypothetical protein
MRKSSHAHPGDLRGARRGYHTDLRDPEWFCVAAILKMDEPPGGKGFRLQVSGFSYKDLMPETSTHRRLSPSE